ncbi:uncharacterized protein N7484_001800 [Penicillium longicatenatum]|uniref:uncharacterized protein n=1 Tax=Penicillium longicatenatum TaxID=1561947 RepID=UPI00254953C0|nr:uncharacterized protein N7484_001800 [Penicillium longicatenatum]KAJ5658151.1 hypothetical protein N7484_001800 [Penicillium longicatenatum]
MTRSTVNAASLFQCLFWGPVLFYADLGFFGFQVLSPTGPKALHFGQRYIWFIKSSAALAT